MRILLLTHYYAPEQGAPQWRWSNFVKRFRAAGHEVMVMAPPPHYPSGSRNRAATRLRPGTTQNGQFGEVIHRVAYLPHGKDILTRTADHTVAMATTVARALHLLHKPQHRPDVVVATAPAIPTLLAGNVISEALDIPYVIEMRDAWPDLISNTDGLTSRSWPVARAKAEVHKVITDWQLASTTVVTTTRTFAQVLAERGVDDLAVIRNGTTLERLPRPATDPSARGGPLRVLYLGTIGRSQGLDVVVRAAARLQAAGTDIEVRLVGHGADTENLQNLVHQLDAPVEILPRVPRSKIGPFYEWADTTLVSLRDWKPFDWTVPSKLYELLATGRHVTGLLHGEAATILAEAGVGALLDPGDEDGLVAAWHDLAAPRERLAPTSVGRDWVRENANHDRLAGQYLELLSDVAARGVRRRDERRT